jgi:hypothetical protein
MTDKAANDQLQSFDSNAMPWVSCTSISSSSACR